MIGGADLNGKINIKDATTIQKHIAKIIELDEKALVCSDVNADNKVNIKDATAIQKFIAQIEDIYKIGQWISI